MPISFTNNDLEAALLDSGVSENDLEKAKVYQNKYGGELEFLLVNLGALDEEQLPSVYSNVLQQEIVTSLDGLEVLSALEALNIDFLVDEHWLPVVSASGEIKFLTNRPLSWPARQYLQLEMPDYQVLLCNDATFDDARMALNTETEELSTDDSLLSDLEEDRLRELASEAPTVNLLNSLISKGLKLGASDMHIEPEGRRGKVRYRIDGVLHDVETVPSKLFLPVISRLKILSGMDIAEKRRPQDGKIELKIASIELDIRVSSLPLNEGESMVMRFLRKDSVRYDMEVLGLSPDIKSLIEQDLQHTSGVILMTGPTGSGKTTTLYTFLNKLNTENVKIITLEDPVEYQLEGVNQVQVNADIGFTFAAGLKSIVRQDPDIIMVGEIRDAESARIAMQSALTGHLVFSTVHTNDAPSAYTRLLDLGVEEFLLNAAVVAIVAQRLARRLCQHCSQPHPDMEALVNEYNLSSVFQGQPDLRQAVGCEHCDNTGFKGRTAIIEYLRCDEALKEINKDSEFIQKAKALNRHRGRRTLMEDGLLKACQGITTIEEVVRVAG